MAHTRKRSATLSNLLKPSTPLRDGSTKTLILWVNDNITDRVVLNHESWPGVAVGHVIQVQSSTSAARGDEMSNFCFVVGADEGHKHGALQVSEDISLKVSVIGANNYWSIANKYSEAPCQRLRATKSSRSDANEGELTLLIQ